MQAYRENIAATGRSVAREAIVWREMSWDESPIGAGTGTAVGLTVTAILLSRQTVRRAFGPEPGWHETVTVVLTVGGVFYGLLLGLIAAASYDAAQSRVADEAAAVGTRYREVSAHPGLYWELLRDDDRARRHDRPVRPIRLRSLYTTVMGR